MTGTTPLPNLATAAAARSAPLGGLVVILSGPSGVGKDTITDELLSLGGAELHSVITVTTRAPRPGEQDGVNYFYISDADFSRLRDEGELLEWAHVHDHEYGVPKDQLRSALAAGQDVLLRIDVQGAATIKRKVPQAVTIFVAPASMEELTQRLAERRTESPDEFALRIRDAHAEMARQSEYDYVVINEHGQLDRAVDAVRSIISAEHSRRVPRLVTL